MYAKSYALSRIIFADFAEPPTWRANPLPEDAPHPCAIVSSTRNLARVVELVDAVDSKNLFTLEKQAAARGYARVKKVSFAT